MIIWLLAVLAVPAFFVWVLVHELWHAVVAWAEGRRVLAFRPWPHTHKGEFYFGRVHTDPPSSSTISALAPYCFDCAVLGATSPLLFTMTEPYVWTMLYLVHLCALVDIGAALFALVRDSYCDLTRVDPSYAVAFYCAFVAFCAVISVVTTLQFSY